MRKSSISTAEIARVARETLSFETLRPGQEEAVRALLEGHDTLVVQPTGSGKSAIYQIAGLLLDGVTVVVSPLIALQKDQVDALEAPELPQAVAVNSTQPARERNDQIAEIERGTFQYVLLAPEQLRKPEIIESLKNANPALFVVDEAHCISEWGHDFRPDYLALGQIVEALDHPRLLALTATATERVRLEIAERLGMRSLKVFVRGFDRPNIHLRVDRFKTEAEKQEAVVHRARWSDKPGIIYTRTRKAAEDIVSALADEGVAALFYHGGMKAAERHEIQERFMANKTEIMVATNAFGMGVDKPDIRFVFHFDVPESLDSYYQEIGRAGRDGAKAQALLFYRHQDIGSQSFKTGEGKVEPQVLEELAARIADQDRPADPEEIGQEIGLSPRKLTSALQRLTDVGATETLPDGAVRSTGAADPGEAARQAAEEHEARTKARRERLEQMREYAETSSCRREFLLRYLGDEYEGPCGSCDNCERAAGVPNIDTSEGTRREVV
jgi:ATP-dependent DNA helicase RecQ